MTTPITPTSLDRKLRNAIQQTLIGKTDAACVVTYQRGPFTKEALPAVNIEVGGMNQRLSGNENLLGQRLFERRYELFLSVVSVEKAENFSEQCSWVGDQVQTALADFGAIPDINIQDLTLMSSDWMTWDGDKGTQAQLLLSYSLTVSVNEATPDIAVGRYGRTPQSAFR